jgi:branched-chain amino acid transport system permease protein
MGAVAVAVVVFAPAGIWGFVRDRWGVQLLPLQRQLIPSRLAPQKSVSKLELAQSHEPGRP